MATFQRFGWSYGEEEAGVGKKTRETKNFQLEEHMQPTNQILPRLLGSRLVWDQPIDLSTVNLWKGSHGLKHRIPKEDPTSKMLPPQNTVEPLQINIL